MPTYEETELGYHNLWNDAKLVESDRAKVEQVVEGIIHNQTRYQDVQRATGEFYELHGVPWVMIGALHNRESSLSFSGHLHNGDPLTARTVHVPAGRPAPPSQPPFTWEESAMDALTMEPHSLHKIVTWTIERILYECERYNGFGYYGKCNSPYIWACTDQYEGGKYTSDGHYDPNAWDKQVGCAAIYKLLHPVGASLIV